MHRQIKIVAILMIVEGALELLMGGVYCIIGPVMMTFMRSTPPPTTPGAPAPPPPEMFAAIYIAIGVATIIGAIVKIIAGIRNASLRNRVLGFVGLGMGLLAFGTCYCVLPALALGIYGIIVLVNDKSAQAFALVESGMPPEQALAQLDAMPAGHPPQPYPPQYPPQ